MNYYVQSQGTSFSLADMNMFYFRDDNDAVPSFGQPKDYYKTRKKHVIATFDRIRPQIRALRKIGHRTEN